MRTTLDIIMFAAAVNADDKLLWVYDAGHEWLIVNDDDLADLGLSDKDFSSYSYRQGEWRALEGDCDAAIYINRLSANREGDLATVEMHCGADAPVRHWPRIH